MLKRWLQMMWLLDGRMMLIKFWVPLNVVQCNSLSWFIHGLIFRKFWFYIIHGNRNPGDVDWLWQISRKMGDWPPWWPWYQRGNMMTHQSNVWGTLWFIPWFIPHICSEISVNIQFVTETNTTELWYSPVEAWFFKIPNSISRRFMRFYRSNPHDFYVQPVFEQ